MNKIFLILSILLLTSNCTFNKVVKKHGVRNLDIKHQKLELNVSNKNDIRQILGPPSTTSNFDNDLWIYIEREISREPLKKLGKEILITNNVLIIEINSKGLLVKKDFYNLNNMNEISFDKDTTTQKYTKRTFVYDFLSSLRQKINDPLGKRKKP
ncbi:outer membrane protein assembly factor BamE domain-containing protein [Candidatus Pelagibacter sp.]|uniref:outer membrane protein assembly factor BamE domain-containing protein n=1 Tax=Candidatus Pelagibacter sp. TaxID=2024849 RepID=UPI003F85F13B